MPRPLEERPWSLGGVAGERWEEHTKKLRRATKTEVGGNE